jgi:hypothetical protein
MNVQASRRAGALKAAITIQMQMHCVLDYSHF